VVVRYRVFIVYLICPVALWSAIESEVFFWIHTKASTEGGLQNICSEGTFQLDMAVCSYRTKEKSLLEKSGLFY